MIGISDPINLVVNYVFKPERPVFKSPVVTYNSVELKWVVDDGGSPIQKIIFKHNKRDSEETETSVEMEG